MNGALPTAAAHAALLVFALAGAEGCAHRAPAERPSVSPGSQLEHLRSELAARDQTIQQLEGQLAMSQAAERQLRERLEQRDGEGGLARETVRIGRAPEPVEPEPPPLPPPEPRVVLGNPNQARPLLRLHQDGREERREFTSTWTPPVARERLSIAQVPELPASEPRTPRAKPTAIVTPARPIVPVAEARMPEGRVAESPVVQARGPADELYRHALDLLGRRELPEALRELDAFVRDFPSEPRNGRAQYFRGEILYAQREFARALAAYEQALVRDPNGDKAPDTLLRIARCQTQLGAHERARAALNKLRTQFPNSEAARVAAQVKQEDT